MKRLRILQTPPRFIIRPITETDAREMATWRYPPPYALYSLKPEDVDELLDPAMAYAAVEDEHGKLAGFFCFGSPARVPGGERTGLYTDDALDLGLGLRPELTGQGLGTAFLRAGMSYAMARYRPAALRLSVATFNRRAIRVYERAGFTRLGTCISPVAGVETEFLVMRRPVGSADSTAANALIE